MNYLHPSPALGYAFEGTQTKIVVGYLSTLDLILVLADGATLFPTH